MKDSDKKQLGACIRRLRLAAGLSQRELGGRIGVTGQMISHYETGTNVPQREENIRALAAALGIDRAQFPPPQTPQERSEVSKRSAQTRREQAERKRREQERQAARWMDEARQAAQERRARDKARREAARRRRQTEPETGATSGFVAYAELEDMPGFRHEIIIEQHIRRMLFLCGEYRRLGNVKKTCTPEGVAWSA